MFSCVFSVKGQCQLATFPGDVNCTGEISPVEESLEPWVVNRAIITKDDNMQFCPIRQKYVVNKEL